ADLGLVPAEPGETADIEFVPGAFEGSVVVSYYAPVAALGTAVDSLTREQLNGLLAGSITDWEAVGGLPGVVRPIWGFDPATAAVVAIPPLLGDAAQGGTYEQIRASMSIDSGFISLFPIDEIDPSVMTLTIDGVDIVRGFGDTSAWPWTS